MTTKERPTTKDRPSTKQRPLRSIALNFDEGDDIESMRAAFGLGSDAVALDLEDQVPRSKLTEARANIRTVLDEHSGTVFVRVNKIDNPEILADLEAVVSEGLHAVFLPKVESPREIVALDRMLSLFERRAGLEEGSTLVTPLLETASGIRQAYEIATASPRIAYLGGCISKNGDPAISIGFHWTPEMTETLYIRQKVLLDARAAGIPYPVGGLWNPIDQPEALVAFAEQSRRIGYIGLITMPMAEHIKAVHEVFTPAQDEVDFWASLIPLVEEAETHVFVNGEMFPPNKIKWGRRQLALAEAFGVQPRPDRPTLQVESVGSMAKNMKAIHDRGRA